MYPLIIPSSYLNSDRILPHEPFSEPKFVLTWVKFGDSSTMTYVNGNDIHELNAIYSDWQQRAFENLRNSSDYFHTNTKYRRNGNGILWIAFLNSDGIGSSRILLSEELSQGFPEGYYLALPDRSCGMVISKNITSEELSEAKQMVLDMFSKATTPMSGALHEPHEFALPKKWLAAIDLEFSKVLVEAIK